MWNAADMKNKTAKNIVLLSSCGVAYGATIVKARTKEIVMITVSITAVPRSKLTESLWFLDRNSRRHAALDSAPTDAAAAEPTTAEAAKKAGRSSIMTVTNITAGQLDQPQNRTTLR